VELRLTVPVSVSVRGRPLGVRIKYSRVVATGQTRGFETRLSGGIVAAEQHPVVCHHDAEPNNTVFRSGVPVAFIDFDLAAPGDPLEDLGYMAWTWCVASKPEFPPPAAQAAQLRPLADAYGLAPGRRPGLADAIVERQTRNMRFWHARLADVPEARERSAWSERERRYTLACGAAFLTALR
jgi:aminoglycoside phosphotransferase (APT) family kinase protein